MHAHASICVIADDAEQALRFTRDIRSNWPDFAPAPESHTVELANALEDLPGIAASSAVVLFGRDQAAVRRIADALNELAAPVLLLSEHDDVVASRLAGSGVAHAPIDAPPLTIATMLYTLLERQHIVRDLNTEVSIARRYQGGLRDEMDKMHEELQLAARVQREILPKSLPTVAGVEFAVLFRPCSYVSGDIYDVVRLSEHEIGFFVADAVGHGVPAALMTMVVSRGLPMTDVGDHGARVVPPAEALSRLNASLCRGQGPAHRFITAVYGVLDSRDRRITLAGAGHPAPLVIDPTGEAQPIETSGALLGVFSDAVYDEVSFHLDDNQILLLYSDGFETAFPRDEVCDFQRRLPTTLYMQHFAALARGRRQASLTEAMAELATTVEGQSGSLHQVDDLTALALATASVAAAEAGDTAGGVTSATAA